jgi:hypothetical protein
MDHCHNLRFHSDNAIQDVSMPTASSIDSSQNKDVSMHSVSTISNTERPGKESATLLKSCIKRERPSFSGEDRKTKRKSSGQKSQHKNINKDESEVFSREEEINIINVILAKSCVSSIFELEYWQEIKEKMKSIRDPKLLQCHFIFVMSRKLNDYTGSIGSDNKAKMNSLADCFTSINDTLLTHNSLETCNKKRKRKL